LTSVTLDLFRPEIEEALEVFDRYVVCLDKTRDDCLATIESLVRKAIETFENRPPGMRHGIALDRHLTVILSQSEGDRPLCAIYFNLHTPYFTKPLARRASDPT